jgi:hypothetical protein
MALEHRYVMIMVVNGEGLMRNMQPVINPAFETQDKLIWQESIAPAS